MKVCLIKPPKLDGGMLSMSPSPSLGLAYIAAAILEAGHEVSVIDCFAEYPTQLVPFKPFGKFVPGHENLVLKGMSEYQLIERIPHDADVIGFSCMFTNNWIADRYLMQFVKQERPEAILIAGGEHITGVPDVCLKQAPLDFVVLGEGEQTMVELLEAIKDKRPCHDIGGIAYKNNTGEIIIAPKRERMRTLDELPWPAWHLFPIEQYVKFNINWSPNDSRSLPIMATRGCPYKCTFCSSPDMWGTRYFLRSPENVVAEMEYLLNTYGITSFDFYDLTAILKKEWIVNFAKLIIQKKMNITWQIPAGTRSESIDTEVARYLYLSGCRHLVYAPESGSQRLLDLIKKKVNLPRLMKSMRGAREQGLTIYINMIVGLPDETVEDILRSFWFLVKCSWVGVGFIGLANFSPYPGSFLFKRLVGEGQINPETDDYYLNLVYIDRFLNQPVYNSNMPRWIYQRMRFLMILVFYSTNYLFRPVRFFRTFRNIITGKYDVISEKSAANFLKRKFPVTAWAIR